MKNPAKAAKLWRFYVKLSNREQSNFKKKEKCRETNHQRSATVVHGWWPADIGC